MIGLSRQSHKTKLLSPVLHYQRPTNHSIMYFDKTTSSNSRLIKHKKDWLVIPKYYFELDRIKTTSNHAIPNTALIKRTSQFQQESCNLKSCSKTPQILGKHCFQFQVDLPEKTLLDSNAFLLRHKR